MQQEHVAQVAGDHEEHAAVGAVAHTPVYGDHVHRYRERAQPEGQDINGHAERRANLEPAELVFRVEPRREALVVWLIDQERHDDVLRVDSART